MINKKKNIVGAGPVGLMCAYELGKRGHKAYVYEEHKKIGEPVQCTGIVTQELMNLLTPKKGVVVNKLKYVVIHTHNKRTRLEIDDLVIDRKLFDNQIKEMAQENGAIIACGKKIDKEDIKDFSRKKHIIIGADGPASILQKKIMPELKIKYLTGKQLRIKGNFEPQTYHVYLGSEIPGFFGWIVPENKNIARIGLATQKNVVKHFESFIEKIGVDKKKSIEEISGLIPIYSPKTRYFKDNMFLLGDAAAQVKATTGGGLVPGLKAAKCLAKAIDENLDYKILLKKNIEKEMKLHKLIRETLNKFSDKDYDRLVDIISRPRNKKLLSKNNRDNLKTLIFWIAASNPDLVCFLPKLFKRGV
ncbi:MAG: geranylgeranyl reductase family protein [Nanobdellota archaeon]